MVPELQILFSDFKCFLEEQCNRMELPQLSLCIEMSTHSKQEGRVHLHAVFSRPEVKAHIGWPVDWVFRSSKPLLRLNTTPGRHAHKSMARARYYAQAPKIGWVCGASTYQKHVQLGVEPTWILGLWRLRKLSHESAKQEIIACRVNVQRYLKEIEFIENKEAEIADQLEAQKVNELLARNFREFVKHDEVELWKLQYSSHAAWDLYGIESRFKFLVLNGPSSTGKTCYAKNLFGQAQTLLVPCQNVAQPCLKNFIRSVHKCIVFDECNWTTIVKNKSLFQANADGYLLAQSQCQEHAYWKLLYHRALIICCNDWLENSDPDCSDTKWLVANSIVIDVQTRMYV